jgi:UDP-3-O-[3-hydroxymyristoyl] glucosamine N-acyltransferase
MKLAQLAEKIGAQLVGAGDAEIVRCAGMRDSSAGAITFITDARQAADPLLGNASAVIAPLNAPELPVPALRVRNPRLAFAAAIALLHVPAYQPTGISAKAHIGADATIGADPSIHPFAVVDDGAQIGDRVTLYPGVYIGKGSSVGDDSVVHANVSIGANVRIGKRVIIHSGTALGSDGFGFVTDGGKHHKMPQVGGVVIEDDVELGGNCTIDRATLGNTIIRTGTKLDNQVHVAHNVEIGEHCLIAGQVGIAGSTTIGKYVVFGGQVGVADHTKVGDKVMAGGKAVIAQDVEPGKIIAGFNAMPIRDWLKVQAVLPKLPELRKQVLELEKKIAQLMSTEKP